MDVSVRTNNAEAFTTPSTAKLMPDKTTQSAQTNTITLLVKRFIVHPPKSTRIRRQYYLDVNARFNHTDATSIAE